MTLETLRVYEHGHLHDMPLTNWYEAACRLSEDDGFDWRNAFDRVLCCDGIGLTDDRVAGAWIEVRFWSSEVCGIFVLIETPLAAVEQIVIPAARDWLPFLTQYLVPLMSVAAQTPLAEQQSRIGNALIAQARHGSGEHIDAASGASKIDIKRDAEARRRQKRMQQGTADAKGDLK